MYRADLEQLKRWKEKENRKPLVVRGARQVGKSHLVRAFAAECFENFVEINLETEVDAPSLFASREPNTIVRFLEARYGKPLLPGRSLLFLDEIQAAPELFAALRYFFEKLPALHVVAAGSLLDLALAERGASIPVGRIEFHHLGPMTFEEFLLAADKKGLAELLCTWVPTEELPQSIHAELMRLLRQYLVVGGMPAAAAAFFRAGDFRESAEEQQSILTTYRDDFAKYGGRADRQRLEILFARIPRLVGGKFKYSLVDREERSRDLGRALDLLCRARVAHRVRHTAANGLPLGAQADDRDFKLLFLDVGLLCRSCGLGVLDVERAGELLLVNSGALCEQHVGQHLLYAEAPFVEPELHCWMRQKSQSNAEVDYVVAVDGSVVPVEVKAGKTGTLKSLQVFLREKRLDFALRFNADRPSSLDAETTLPGGDNRRFRLLSLPLYMVGQAARLCRAV